MGVGPTRFGVWSSHLLATPSLFATLTLLPHQLPDLKVC